jgi:hypothetical protein
MSNLIPGILIASIIITVLQLFSTGEKSSSEIRHQGGSNKSTKSKSKKRSNKTRKTN